MPGTSSSPQVLVADDQQDVLEALRLLLKSEGYHTETVSSPAGVLRAVEAKDFDAVLMDMNYTRDTTSGLEGMDLISRLRTMDASLRRIARVEIGSNRYQDRIRIGLCLLTGPLPAAKYCPTAEPPPSGRGASHSLSPGLIRCQALIKIT